MPVFFYSPGGQAVQGLAIGRKLRARGLTAGVAVTVPQNCLPTRKVDECSKLMRQPEPPQAQLWTTGASCNSACAYAILGAVQREISPAAGLGVHSGLSYLKWASPGATQRQRAQAIENGHRRTEGEVQRYLAEMGISKDLFTIVKETKFEQLHLLTRAELFSLGIDRREIADSGWQFNELSSSLGSVALTTVVAKDRANPGEFRQFVLTVSCRGARAETYTNAPSQ